MISKLRLYFNNLSKVDQRAFVSPGVRCTLNTDRMAEGGDMSFVRLHDDFRLEDNVTLEDRLHVALVSGYKLPPPERNVL